MTETDKARITNIVEKVTGRPPANIELADSILRFDIFATAQMAEMACQTLLDAGLQHNPYDDLLEYEKTVTEGAELVLVRWPIDESKPLWGVL